MLGWVVKNIFFYSRCAAGLSKVGRCAAWLSKICIFTVGALQGCQNYTFLRQERCKVVKSMRFYGGCVAGLSKVCDFHGKCAAGLSKVCIFTVNASLGSQKYEFLL